ncbi:hypothetical protein EVAR_97097_1 [Eumeta japonica]|uniref:Uncharacterized protein n=1 Tax=Eumeta variegata TaxID=151549 RepID=A0A4C1X8N3_EUMVA|nr:hypothetical protein EVAR_97097_1 [Eumeta japonica]
MITSICFVFSEKNRDPHHRNFHFVTSKACSFVWTVRRRLPHMGLPSDFHNVQSWANRNQQWPAMFASTLPSGKPSHFATSRSLLECISSPAVSCSTSDVPRPLPHQLPDSGSYVG